MATQVQFRGGSTAEHGNFNGAPKEVTVDTDKDVVVVHTNGGNGTGVPMFRAEGGAQDISTTGDVSAADGTFTGTVTIGGTALTSTTAELNILDGVTSTTAELNILDGVTSTTAELNILDGVTSTTAQLNYSNSVTSNIQTQIDAKAPTASPVFTGDASVTGDLRVGSTSALENPPLGIEVTGSASGAVGMTLINTEDSDADATCVIRSYQENRAGGDIVFGRENADNWSASYNLADGFISFNPTLNGSATERMRINSAGSVLIGPSGAPATTITSAGAATFTGNVGVGTDAHATVIHHVQNSGDDWIQRLESTHATAGCGGMYINYSNDDPDSATEKPFIQCNAHDGTTNNGKCTVWSNGDVDNATGVHGSLSDVKLKQDIVDAASQWDDIKAVKVRNFKFKTDTTKTLLGVIAQEIETVSPGLVKDTPDRDADGNLNGETTKSVKSSILYMKAIKALQEAMAKIETLETKVAALEAA